VKARRARKTARPRNGGAAALRKRLREVERQLRVVQERHEIAMGAINEGLYDWDIARNRVHFWGGMERLLRLPAGALRSSFKEWHSRIHPDDFARYREATIAHLKGKTERFECDYRYRALDGTWRWARTHGLAQRDAAGRAVRMVGSTGDITELKEREQQLAEQKTLLENTLENIDQGITMVDRDLRTIALNRRFLELLGFPPERFARGFHMEEAFRFNAERGEYGPGDVEEQVRQRLALARRFEPHAFERTRPNGRVIAIRGKPMPGGGFVSTYTDVTEQKRSEERYALATSAAAEGIYEWDIETETLFLTERAKTFFSIEGESLTPAAWNARVHREDFAGYRAALIEHFKGRTPHLEHEYRIADGRGGYKWVLDRGIGVRNAAGRVIRMVGALSDITQRKLAEIERAATAEQQKAAGEVLRVISSAIADTGPVFDKILESCQRLFAGRIVGLNLVREDGLLHIGAYHGAHREEFERIFPIPVTSESGSGLSIVERRVVHYPDAQNGAEVPARTRQGCTTIGIKSAIFAPLLWEGRGVGAIFVGRDHVSSFSENEIALLRTFADQAAIAIENVRLFKETQEALEQQRAAGEVLRVIASSIADTGPVFDKILESCERLFEGHPVGLTLAGEDGQVHLGAYRGERPDRIEQVYPYPLGRDSGSGQAMLDRKVVQFADIGAPGSDAPPKVLLGAQAVGAKSIIFAPLVAEGQAIGALWIGRGLPGPFGEKQTALLKTFADQAVIAIRNARLFREIQEKSRQLEVASRHKSEFLANMSHELRTPLNAVIGFTRIVMRRSREQLEPKQYENLEKILASGEHLLALINSVLDLSKIEAGRLEVHAGEVALAPVLEHCLRTVEPLAKVPLVREFDGELPRMYVDEEKLRQIVINLLSNAAKFTERGDIRLKAQASDGSIAIAISDTGIGIAPDKLELIFEEFEQADSSSTRSHRGTGLGLAIARRLARLMGGEVTAESMLGSGSTFRLTLPLRYGRQP
jgi:PAS domain S-box-containing protein